MDLSIVFDVDEFRALGMVICERVDRVGLAEVERRIGCKLEEIFADMIETVPSNDGLTIYLRPSARFRDMAAAVIQARPLLRAIGMT